MDEIFKTWMPQADGLQLEKLETYYAMLIDWNARMNLTAITDKAEAAQKHFADSLLPEALIPQNAKLIDVGTGAGFPGLVLKIMRPDIKLTLLDSLNKRIMFLQAVCAELGLSDVDCIHARAEEGARRIALRERFDVATARAVAHTAFLAEWLTPYVKVGGKALLYKGPQAKEELSEAKNACKLLHAEPAITSYTVPWGDRSVTVLTKTAPADKRFPRKAGTKEHL